MPQVDLPSFAILTGFVTANLPVLVCVTCSRPVAWLKLESTWDGWFPLYEYRVRRTTARGSCKCASAEERLARLGPTLRVGSGLPHHLIPENGLSWEIMTWEANSILRGRGRWLTPLADQNAERIRENLAPQFRSLTPEP